MMAVAIERYRALDQQARRWWWRTVLQAGLLLSAASSRCYRAAGGVDPWQQIQHLEARVKRQGCIISTMCEEKRLDREDLDRVNAARQASAQANGALRAEVAVLVAQSAKRGELLRYMVKHLALRLPRHVRNLYHDADVTPPRVSKRDLAAMMADAKGTARKPVRALVRGRRR